MKLPHFLTVLLAGTISASAASTVLYQTSWDPTPAPAWAAGAINGQNGWFATSTSGFQVVANGSAAALGVVTPSGNQFARLLANPSITGSSNRYAWTDLTAQFAARPAGQNILKASFDVYMPMSQEFDGSLYGIRAFHPTSIPYSLLIEADDRSINLLVGGSFVYVSNAYDYDTWFNVAVFANYTTGDLTVSKNGVLLPTVTGNNPAILSGSLEDVDLFSINDPSGPATRAMFVENFSVSVEGNDPPSLTIAPIPPDNIAYRIKWPAANATWILEYTDDLVTGGSVWSAQGTAPEADADPRYVHVDVGLDTLHRYFRLRQPLP